MRFNHHMIHAVAVCLLLLTPSVSLSGITTADVAVLSPGGQFSPLVSNQLVHANWDRYFWSDIPPFAKREPFRFWQADLVHSPADGITTFEVLTDGPVLMAVTTRWAGGGNSSGGWVPELTSRAELALQGWSEFATGLNYTRNGGPDPYIEFTVLRRDSVAGDVFTYRTEKYQTPIILLSETTTPEPVPAILIASGGGTYFENFDSLGFEGDSNAPLPGGWTSSVSDTIYESITVDFPPLVLENGTYSAGAIGSSDRALAGGIRNYEEDNVLTMEGQFSGEKRVRAINLSFDIEAWGANGSAVAPGEAAYVVELETSSGNRPFGLIESFNEGNLVSTGQTLARGNGLFSTKDGNDPANRMSYNSGVTEVNVSENSLFRLSFDATGIEGTREHLFGLDNVSFRTLGAGDVDGNGIVDVQDLLDLLQGGQFGKGTNDVTWEQGDFDGNDAFDVYDLLEMLQFLSGQFPSDPYASEAVDAVADVIVNSQTGEVTVDLAGHTVSAIIIGSAAEIFNGEAPDWDTTSQFPSTLPGELGNVLFTSTASGIDELGAVISTEFLGRDKEFYLEDLDFNILIASDGGALTKGNVIVVPEPNTWLLLGMGLAFIAVARMRLI